MEPPRATPRAAGALGVLTGHTTVYLLGSLAAKASSILLLPVFTPLLAPEEFGVLSLANATLSLLLQLVGMQLDAAMVRHWFDARGDARRRVVSTAFLALALLSAVVGVVLVAGAPWLAPLLPDDGTPRTTDLANVLRLVGIILVAMVLSEVAISVLRAERRSVAAVGWQLLRLACEIVGKVLLVVVFGLGVLGVLLGQAIAAVAFLIGVSVWILRRFGTGFDVPLLRAMVAFSAPMVVSGLGQFALHSADRLMLPALAGYAPLGLYEVGYQFGFAVQAIALGPFLSIWYPYVFSLEDAAERRRVQAAAAVHVPAVLVAGSLPVALFAPEIVRVFTDAAYHDAWRYVPMILLSYVVWAVFQVQQTPFYVAKQTARVPRLVWTATAVNVLLNLALVPWLGAMGAALATLVAMVVLAGITRRAAVRIEPAPADVRRLVVLLVLCTCAGLAVHLLPETRPLDLGVRGTVLVAALAVLAGPFLRPGERDAARALLRRRGSP